MKRLTISMSDELFDKLDVIENKSLFIRKLIERELDMLDNVPADNVIPWTERFAILRNEVNTVLNRLEMIEKNIPGINEMLENVQSAPDIANAYSAEIKDGDELIFESYEMEESANIGITDGFEEIDIIAQANLKPLEQKITEPIEPPLPDNEEAKQELAEPVQETIIKSTERVKLETETEIQQIPEESIHEMKLSEIMTEKINETGLETAPQEIENTAPIMPEMKQPEQANQDTGFVMPELKPPEQANQEPEFVMPELKPPEQANQNTGFVMPELKPPEQANQEPEFVMPELKPPEQANQEPEFVMPELKPPERASQNTGFVMPELKPPEQANQDSGFVMPELKPPEQANQNTGFVMPELKPPEQANQDTGFVMPELKPTEQANQDTGFVMPELKPTEQASQNTGFVIPELKPPEHHTPIVPDFKLPEGMPTFELPDMKQPANFEGMPEVHNAPPQPAPSIPAPMTEQSNDTKLDKLEGNILMYMPRGAKVKKEIIKSLVSRQFSQEDIDRKIQELVAKEVLVLKQENGIEQLHRLK